MPEWIPVQTTHRLQINLLRLLVKPSPVFLLFSYYYITCPLSSFESLVNFKLLYHKNTGESIFSPDFP